jgi:hypothetical protein
MEDIVTVENIDKQVAAVVEAILPLVENEVCI